LGGLWKNGAKNIVHLVWLRKVTVQNSLSISGVVIASWLRLQ